MKGPHSQEAKDKIRNSLKGRKVGSPSIEHRINLSNALKGKKGTYGHLGKKHSEETKIKISKSKIGKMLGENNPSWKGGITSLALKIRNCFRYRQWISDVFQRDKYICQECGQKGGDLEAHHIDRFSDILHRNSITSLEMSYICAELWNINNGKTLCVKCHKETFKKYE